MRNCQNFAPCGPAVANGLNTCGHKSWGDNDAWCDSNHNFMYEEYNDGCYFCPSPDGKRGGCKYTLTGSPTPCTPPAGVASPNSQRVRSYLPNY
jgi:hypothetical protein